MFKKKFLKKNKFLLETKLKNLKILPYSLEAEQSVLGSLMLDNERWNNVIEKITKNDFYNRSHRHIFNEMKNLIYHNQPIDLITLSEALEKKKKLKFVGGFAYLAELSKNIPSTANILAYVDIVRDRAIMRDMISIAHDITDASYNPQGRSSEDLLDLAESRIFKISENRINRNDGPKSIEYILEETINRIENLYQKPYSGITGISSGYLDLDRKTTGFQKSDLIIIAARPSMGKTSFAMNICENISIIEDKPIIIFSLEMPSDQIMIRILSSLSRVDQTRIRTGQLNDEDWARISSTMGFLLEKKNIYIDDSSRLTPIEIRFRARKIFREHKGLSLIMIDYLQLMRVPLFSDNRTLEIAEISRSLKALAKELNVPVIAVSQLNRSLEQRIDKRPVNSDLRESGSIEQDADLIMFIYREEVYNEDTDLKGIAEIIIGKHRNGPIGTIRLIFNGKFSRFDNYADSKYYIK